MQLSLEVLRESETNGGLLVHGALAEWKTCGIILAGPSGAGKTTASERLRDPWRSLSDDATLIVCDQRGKYWAHPWPTWGRFFGGGKGGTWGVEHTVPLRAIFFLKQATENRAYTMGSGQGTALLVQAVEQVFMPTLRTPDDKEGKRTERLRCFDNICALAKVVPTYLLHLNKTGEFWREIERALDGNPNAT